MSQQVWKYLPHVPQINKKKTIFKKKSEITDKEVLNLTGGLFPLKIQENKIKSNKNKKNQHWVYCPIVQSNASIGPIYHWTRQGDQNKLYHGQKFNLQSQILTFTKQQFQNCKGDYPWTYQKAKEIFELLKIYNMNFIIVNDRLPEDYGSIQDLKEIYFTINRLILKKRNDNVHPLTNYIFDKKYECSRKFEMQKYLMRNKIDNQRQKILIAEIRRLEILIKKQERQQINLKKVLKLQEVPQELFELQQMDLQKLMNQQKVYTRQQYLIKPLKLPGKINDKLLQVLHGMSIPQKIIATEENMHLYDKLRQKVLLMFSIQRYIRIKDLQRRTLEEKKKKIMTQEQQERKGNNTINSNKQIEALPKKKIHTNKP